MFPVLNAAAAPKYQRLHETPPEEFERQWRVGAFGAALCCRKALPGMMKRKSGRVVFVATSAAQGAALAKASAYVSAKYALLGLAKAVEAEAGPRGVSVACAFPGMTDTDMIKDFPRPVVEAAREAAGKLSTPTKSPRPGGAGRGRVSALDELYALRRSLAASPEYLAQTAAARKASSSWPTRPARRFSRCASPCSAPARRRSSRRC